MKRFLFVLLAALAIVPAASASNFVVRQRIVAVPTVAVVQTPFVQTVQAFAPVVVSNHVCGSNVIAVNQFATAFVATPFVTFNRVVAVRAFGYGFVGQRFGRNVINVRVR